MKRIVLLGLFLPLLSVGQILVNVPLSDGVLPATWQNVDVDGFAADVFYTDQGIWAGSTAWEEVNFSSYGRAFYSTSNFETATGNANDWMITDAISITQATRLDFELVSSQFNGRKAIRCMLLMPLLVLRRNQVTSEHLNKTSQQFLANGPLTK